MTKCVDFASVFETRDFDAFGNDDEAPVLAASLARLQVVGDCVEVDGHFGKKDVISATRDA